MTFFDYYLTVFSTIYYTGSLFDTLVPCWDRALQTCLWSKYVVKTLIKLIDRNAKYPLLLLQFCKLSELDVKFHSVLDTDCRRNANPVESDFATQQTKSISARNISVFLKFKMKLHVIWQHQRNYIETTICKIF